MKKTQEKVEKTRRKVEKENEITKFEDNFEGKSVEKYSKRPLENNK